MSDTSQDQSTGGEEHGPFATAGNSPTAAGSGGQTSAAPAGPEDGQQLPLDVVFEILKNRRRRLVLRYLTEVSATSTLSELAEQVAAIENDKPVEALSSAERKRVYVGLYQGHLPRLHEAGVVEFDDDRGTVAAAENAPQLTRYLHVEGANRRDAGHSFLAVAAAGGGLFVAQRLLFPSAIASAVIVGLVLCAIAFLALDRRLPSIRGQTGRRSTDSVADSS